jgi:molybdate-binding protein
MEVRELNKWIDAIEDNVKFLQKELKGIKQENDKKLKEMQSSLNYHVDEIRGYHQLQQSQTKVKEDVSGYLVKQISMLPQFKKAVKSLETGADVKLNMELKLMAEEVPLVIRKEMKGTWTKEFESKLNDEVSEKKVEENLKTKSISKDKDGYTYEE